MRFDIENQLSIAQAFTGAAQVTQNSYMKQTALQDLSIGRRVALLVCPSIAAGAGSSVQVEAIQADDAALTQNVTSLASVSTPAAKMVPGQQIEVPIPQGVMNQQFIGGRVTITGGATTMTADIYIVPQDEDFYYKSFPNVTPTLV